MIWISIVGAAIIEGKAWISFKCRFVSYGHNHIGVSFMKCGHICKTGIHTCCNCRRKRGCIICAEATGPVLEDGSAIQGDT